MNNNSTTTTTNVYGNGMDTTNTAVAAEHDKGDSPTFVSGFNWFTWANKSEKGKDVIHLFRLFDSCSRNLQMRPHDQKCMHKQ